MSRLVVKKYTAADDQDEEQDVPVETIRREMQRSADFLAALERTRRDREDVPTMDAAIWKLLEVYSEKILYDTIDKVLDKVYADVNKAFKDRDQAIDDLRKQWRRELDVLISAHDLVLTSEQLKQRIVAMRKRFDPPEEDL